MLRRPPHAPYRSGPPRFAPALQPIDPNYWLTPDTEAHVLDWKAELLARPELVFRQAAGCDAAAAEAAMSVGAALGVRRHDLLSASAQVSDDLVVMRRIEDQWVCTALTLTAPTFFSIDDAFGRGLERLHAPVPGGERLAARIGRVFDGLRPGQVLQRFNWTLQCGDERFTPDGEPLRARAQHTALVDAETALHLRVERQTIVKLPQTGAVLFTIRVCLDPLAAIEARNRLALAAAWRASGPEGRAYKGWTALEPLVSSVFERWGL